MSAPTAGPWMFHESSDQRVRGFIRETAHGRNVPGVMAIGRICYGGRPPAETRANGRVMAAAPEMLTALDALIALNGSESKAAQRTAWGMALAAVARARGKIP